MYNDISCKEALNLNMEFDTCFGDIETISLSNYKNNSVICVTRL